MKIRIGFDIAYQCEQQTPFVFMLNVHPSRIVDLIKPDHMLVTPNLPVSNYLDAFGNICTRVVAPAGELRVAAEALVYDSGEPDRVNVDARQHEVGDLPDETLPFLIASRYCETDRLMQTAWALFAKAPTGWGRVQAICDFVHNHIEFGYPHASVARSAVSVFEERRGVCRDFAHLAVALCRCMNIPARYCTGYLGDIGVPPDPTPMDFSAWFEAFVGGRWYTFDARHNTPRIGRILIARGRDAADVAISTAFAKNQLTMFKVWTNEVSDAKRLPEVGRLVA